MTGFFKSVLNRLKNTKQTLKGERASYFTKTLQIRTTNVVDVTSNQPLDGEKNIDQSYNMHK